MNSTVGHEHVEKLFREFPSVTEFSTCPEVWRWVEKQSAIEIKFYTNLLVADLKRSNGWDFSCPLCGQKATWETKLGEWGHNAILCGLGCLETFGIPCQCPRCKTELRLALRADMTASATAFIRDNVEDLLRKGSHDRVVEAVLMHEYDRAYFRKQHPNIEIL